MSFKIGFLLLVPADLALICWLKVETFLNDLTYGKPSSRVVPAYAAFLQLWLTLSSAPEGMVGPTIK